MLDLVHTDIYENDELKHWGILGMKWGIRRYQNPDGSLTPEGRERYGVKTVAETKKLSYSQKYEHLKNKKDLTEKERKQLENLEKGRDYLIKTNTTNQALTKLDKESIKNGKLATDYMMSTNYGKKVTLYQFLGGPILSSNFALANENDFLKELKEEKQSDNKASDSDIKDNENNTYYSDKKPKNLKSNQIYVDYTGMVYTTRPLTKADTSEDPELKQLMKLFNVKEDDLVIDKNDKSRLASIFRKDGKPFVFKYKGADYNFTNQDLRYIQYEDEWFDDYFKPVK